MQLLLPDPTPPHLRVSPVLPLGTAGAGWRRIPAFGQRTLTVRQTDGVFDFSQALGN